METKPSPEERVLAWVSSSEELPGTLDQVDKAREKIQDYQPRDRKDYTKPILAAFIDHLPWEGKQALAFLIARPGNEQLLFPLAYHLYTTLLLPLQAQNRDSVTQSPFEDAQEVEGDIYQMMLDAASQNDQKQLKRLCLQRDGWRCMLTGAVEISTVRDDPEAHSLDSRLIHILPFSVGKWTANDSESRNSQTRAVLRRLFPALTVGPSDINHPTNLMTLGSLFEESFRKFTLAFEPTGVPNQYKVLTLPFFPTLLNRVLPQPNERGERIVHFSSETNCPLPSPSILRAHACIAKILHSSNVFDQIERVLEMPETTSNLSANGTTDPDFLFWKL